MMRGDASYGLNAPDIIAESVDGEVLIINLRDGTYYSAEGTGGLIGANHGGRPAPRKQRL